MKLAIIGASGFVGSQLLAEALRRGYMVTAFVRAPQNITLQDKNLIVKKVNILNENELSSFLIGHDIVLSAYNPGWKNPNIYNDFIIGSKSIQNATKKAGIKRLLVVGGAGSLEIKPGVQLVDTPEFPVDIKQGALGARDYFNILRKEDDLDWTLLIPAITMTKETSGIRTGKYRIGINQPVFDQEGESKISVEDLAVALLDEVEKN
ncbi:MAG TPA: NAD(P)H-binding protein, partial [Nitrososphaeraceae archaeon]|nr:NAD(P)H-binding protein [Nitrososphaeraceae archaeon]